MKTENEIKALPLLEQQKLVVELRAIKPGDKAYPNAKAIIELITDGKKWKEPKKIKVKNIAGHEVVADETKIAKDAEAEVYPWQYHALARFLEPEEGVKLELEEAGEKGRAEDAKNAVKESPAVDVAKAITEGIEKGMAAVKKSAALILFAFLLTFGLAAGAQTQTTQTGSAGNYHVYYIAGLNGSVGLTGTNSFTAGVVTTNQQVAPGWNYTNGVAYNTPVTNYTYVTNVPGLISCVNNDLVNIKWAFNLNNSGSGAATLTADYSDDLSVWTPALSATLTANGTTQVSTNITLSQFGPGFIRFNTISYPSSSLVQTNVLTVSGKSSKTGPF